MEEQYIFCLDPNCRNKVKNSKWSKTDAEDWFFHVDGTAYCPKHLPTWVKYWRAVNTNGNLS